MNKDEVFEYDTVDKMTGKKVLHIIFQKGQEKPAEFMKTLISNNKNVKCCIWSEKHYEQNPSISSDNIVIFIGDIKRISSSRQIVVHKGKGNIDRGYGGHFGFYGKQAYIWVVNRTLDKIEKKCFEDDCKAEIEKLKSYNIKSFAADTLVIFLFGLTGIAIKKIISSILSKKEKNQMILTLTILKFLNTELKNFLEEAVKVG